ncbi:voltage-gated potassium channel [Aureococcus anophagefferens]|nr:voltage-gated potassium channel [Aureococcus anophagefferens]
MGDREAFAEDGDDAPAVVRSPSPLIIYPGGHASARTDGATVDESNESRERLKRRPSFEEVAPGTALGRSLSASRLGELVSPAAERQSPRREERCSLRAPREARAAMSGPRCAARGATGRPRRRHVEAAQLGAATDGQRDAARELARRRRELDPPPPGLDHLWDPVALGRHQRLQLSDDAKAKANDVVAWALHNAGKRAVPTKSRAQRRWALLRNVLRAVSAFNALGAQDAMYWDDDDVARDAAYFRFDVFVFVWYACDMALSFVDGSRGRGDAVLGRRPGEVPTPLVRYLRVFKMLKLLRAVHLEVAMRRVMKQMRIYPGVDRIAELAVVSLIAGLNREGDGDDNFDLYVTCLYWAITTISTVGFGDIHPNSPGEKIFTSVIMVAGVGMYAIIISSFGARFVHKHDVPMRLATAMHNHQKRYLNAVHLWRTDETEQLVANLPRDLRSALVIHLERSLVSRVPFFIGKPRSFVADAVAVLGPLLADSGEVLVGKGEVANAVYFLLSADGACEAQLIEAANLEMLLNHYVTVRDEVYATAALRVRQSALLGVDDGAAFRRTRSDELFPPPPGPARSPAPGRGYATTPHRRPTTRVRAGVSNVRGAATPPQVQFPWR